MFPRLRLLGEGSFGAVYLSQLDGVPVAVKTVSRARAARSGIDIQQEISILRLLAAYRHVYSNILYLVAEDEMPTEIDIITNYIDGVEVNKGPISPEYMVSMAVQVLSTLAFLHTNSIIHRDIKYDNILYSDPHFVIIDYGLACHEQCEGVVGARTGYTEAVFTHYEYGTTPSFAELKQSDVFAFGVCMFDCVVPESDVYYLTDYKEYDYSRPRRWVYDGGVVERIIRLLVYTPPADAAEALATITPWISNI